MKRARVVRLSFAALLMAFAGMGSDTRPGKVEKINGEVTAIAGSSLQLKAGKSPVTVRITEKTKVLSDAAELAPAALKQGMKVTVRGLYLPSGEFEAAEIRLPGQPASPSSQSAGHSGHAH